MAVWLNISKGSIMAYGKKKMAKGGSLKAAPKGNKGLSKLPKGVRNKMGYMAKGGSATKKCPTCGMKMS